MLLLALLPVMGPLILLAFFVTPGTAGPKPVRRPGDAGSPPTRLGAMLFAVLQIPLQHLLAGLGATALFDLAGVWAPWRPDWGAWVLTLLALGAFVAALVVVHRTVVSRIVL